MRFPVVGGPDFFKPEYEGEHGSKLGLDPAVAFRDRADMSWLLGGLEVLPYHDLPAEAAKAETLLADRRCANDTVRRCGSRSRPATAPPC